MQYTIKFHPSNLEVRNAETKRKVAEIPLSYNPNAKLDEILCKISYATTDQEVENYIKEWLEG